MIGKIKKNPFYFYSVIFVLVHASHDFYLCFLPPFLPIIIERLSISKVEAGLLVVFQQLASSFQPIFGFFADRKNLHKYIFIFPAITGFFMSIIGILPSYLLLSLILIISGISSAIFHSITPPFVGKISGAKIGRGLSFWMVGGQLGIMIGPIVFIKFIAKFGMNNLPWIMAIGIVSSIFLFFILKNIIKSNNKGDHKNQSFGKALRNILPILIPISANVILRSFGVASMEVFLPIFLVERNVSLLIAGTSLSIFTAFGIIGIFIGGLLKEFLGGRNIILISIIGTFFFMLFMVSSSGWIQIIYISLLGFFINMILPINLALVQEYSPINSSLANGFYLAIFFAFNALAGLGVGYMADLWGTRNAFTISAFISLSGIPFVYLLPKGQR